VEEQQVKLPYETGARTQSCEKDYGNQESSKQDDMQFINDVLRNDGFSLELLSDVAYLKPAHMSNEPSNKDLSDLALTALRGKMVKDEGMEASYGTGSQTGVQMEGTGSFGLSGGEGDSDEDDSEEEDFAGYNALQLATYLGQVGTVRLLLQLRPNDADRAAEGGQRHTPLHIAAAHHHLDVVRVLLDHGAKTRLRDGLGCTPLHIAVRAGARGVVRLLVCGCVELLHIRDATRRTPLHDAILKGDEETLRLLLDYGADPNAVVERE
jgi:hypothetical protein